MTNLNTQTTKTVQKEGHLSENQKKVKDIDTNWLHTICSEAGADDAGFVEIEREAISNQKSDILELFPYTKTLISFVCKLNRDNIRVPARSTANLEYHLVNEHTNNVARKIVAALEKERIRAVNPAIGFPMEMNRWPEKVWVISHKPIAVEAGLGKMGIHRSVIHPKYGSFVLLGTILINRSLTSYSKPLNYNPCIECKLCSVACPTGAISPDGHFSFANCLTHTYRELLGGFIDWTENIVESKSRKDYRKRVSDAETVSMWQSLTYGGSYKSVYCIAVCPAGEDVVTHFLEDKKEFIEKIVKPLQSKAEDIYVLPGSDAEDHVSKHFPGKKAKKIGNGLRPRTINGFLEALPLIFQRNKSEGVDTTYHFTFTGKEKMKATVIIRNKSVTVLSDHMETAQIHVTADSNTWLKFLAKERGIIWALFLRRIRVKGPLRLLQAFGRCFPT